MKKNIYRVRMTKRLVLALACAFMLSACQSNGGQSGSVQEETSAASQTSASVAEREENSSSQEKSESTAESAAAAEISEEYQQRVQSVLEGMKNFPYGTSGSSLKVAQLAGQWMELFSSEEFDARWIGQKVAETAGMLDEGKRERFEGLWHDISETVDGWLSGTPEALALIKDAGVEFSGELINADIWKNIQDEIEGAFGK